MILLFLMVMIFGLAVLFLFFTLLSDLISFYSNKYPKFQNVLQKINNFLMEKPFK